LLQKANQEHLKHAVLVYVYFSTS